MVDRSQMVPDAIVNRLLEQDPDGAALMDELIARFVMGDIYVPGDANATMINMGKRELVRELMLRAGEYNGKDNSNG